MRQGEVFRPSAHVAVGLSGFLKVEGRERARLSVGDGPFGVDALVAKGERVRVGSGLLLLEEFSRGEGSVGLRWGLAPKQGAAPRLLSPVEFRAGEPLRLTEMGLYRLPDARVIAVSNVLPTQEVTITVYPAGYAAEPMLGCDRHFLVGAGSTLEGEGGRFVLQRIAAVDPPGWGWVEVVEEPR